jgi:hypothetical protein
VPDSAPAGPSRRKPALLNPPALVPNAEDSESDTIRPRLAALGADLRRLFVAGADESGTGPPLRLPNQAALLGRRYRDS